jgi:penicillin-binding protein 1A
VEWSPGLPEPELLDMSEQVMSPYTAYQITSMMEGVVERGTGKKLKIVGKPVAGKTGTSNEERDAWFIGYTPDLVVGTFVGYDNPKPMGKGRTGGELAAPIVADFMRLALRDKPATPFRVPRAIELIPIDATSGKRAIFGQEGVILEAFKPGDEPPDSTKIIGEGTVTAAAQGQADGLVLVPPAGGGQPAVPVDPAAPGAPAAAPPADGGLTGGGSGLY